MTFDEWLEETDGSLPRRERINNYVDFAAVMLGNISHNLARRRMYEWLETAYNAGIEEAKTRASEERNGA